MLASYEAAVNGARALSRAYALVADQGVRTVSIDSLRQAIHQLAAKIEYPGRPGGEELE